MSINIRLEQESDFREVEELVRDAFWNLYIPGGDEHLLVSNIRKCEDFIKEFDFVAIKDNKIVGNIMFTKSYIEDKLNERHEVLTFGPISVLPEYQKQGVGSALIEYSKKVALDNGYKAIIIYGYPEYYNKLGFKASKEFNITDEDGKYPVALLVLELFEGALKGIEGKSIQSEVFETDESELEEFEKTFPYKEKKVTESQKKFEITRNTFL